MKRQFRLTRSTDFKRVRRFGKSYAHPLLVLVTVQNEEQRSRIGVTAGRNVGGAVQRNRAKRRLRAAIQQVVGNIHRGWDLVLIARPPLLGADFSLVELAVNDVLVRAGLLEMENEGG